MATNPVIAERRNATHGVNGFYDIRLLRAGGNALTIEVSHSIFFNFRPNETNPQITWSTPERAAFIRQFQTQITATWDQANHITIKGHPVSIRFVSDIRNSATGSDWRIRVFKLKSSSSSRQSSVGRGGVSDADLDSNDGRRKILGNQNTQTGIIHEFGHMIGLPDEYRSGPNVNDRPSVMNHGSTVRNRHLAHLVNWARPFINSLEERMSDDQEALPSFLSADRPPTVEAELKAVRDWKGNLAPQDVVLWEVRSRDTKKPIPVDEVDPADFKKLEIVFEKFPRASTSLVWQPRSARAIIALFEGS